MPNRGTGESDGRPGPDPLSPRAVADALAGGRCPKGNDLDARRPPLSLSHIS